MTKAEKNRFLFQKSSEKAQKAWKRAENLSASHGKSRKIIPTKRTIFPKRQAIRPNNEQKFLAGRRKIQKRIPKKMEERKAQKSAGASPKNEKYPDEKKNNAYPEE